MNFNNFTIKSQEAIQKAVEITDLCKKSQYFRKRMAYEEIVFVT